jgi:hypothetical protein
VIALGKKRIRLSPQARLMLYWVRDPEELKNQLKEDFPPILIRNGEILRKDTLGKVEFFTEDGLELAKKGIAELEAKGLIEADRCGDLQTTERGDYEVNIVRGIFPPKVRRDGIHVANKSFKEMEEDEEKARERFLKEKKAWQER